MSKLSLRSARRKFQPRVQVADQAVRLVLRRDADAADARVQRIGQREVDDARLATEDTRRAWRGGRSAPSAGCRARPPARRPWSRAPSGDWEGLHFHLLALPAALQPVKITLASGGSDRRSEYGLPNQGRASAETSPNGAPTLLPP